MILCNYFNFTGNLTFPESILLKENVEQFLIFPTIFHKTFDRISCLISCWKHEKWMKQKPFFTIFFYWNRKSCFLWKKLFTNKNKTNQFVFNVAVHFILAYVFLNLTNNLIHIYMETGACWRGRWLEKHFLIDTTQECVSLKYTSLKVKRLRLFFAVLS